MLNRKNIILLNSSFFTLYQTSELKLQEDIKLKWL